MSEPRATGVHPVDEHNQVVTVEGGAWAFRHVPCRECPWRRDNDGSFPPEAFRHSARTAYDMARSTFACHMAGTARPATCAGFLLSSGAEHNLPLRLKRLRGTYDPDQVSSGGADLHPDYRSMAIANGVEPDDPTIRPCR